MHNSATAQVLLRWATQRGIAVIPKSNNHERLVQNLDCNSFDLSGAELAQISGLNINLRVRVSCIVFFLEIADETGYIVQ